MAEQELEILQGAVSAVVYQNYENGYAVLRLNLGGGQTVTVVGTIPLPAVGEKLMVTGKWSNHPSYGRQFEAEFLERLMPQTAMEILDQVEGEIHGFCSGVGTGGTLSGVGAVLKDRFPDLKIWVAEPQNAAILSQGPIGSHLQMGIGDGLIPDNLDMTIFDQVSIVTDQEAIQTAQRLMREEGILCGISSGSNVTVALRMAKELGEGKTVVTILPDTGERYFSTQLFDV